MVSQERNLIIYESDAHLSGFSKDTIIILLSVTFRTSLYKHVL